MAIVPVSEFASSSLELTKEEAYSVQKEIINAWEPKKEVWHLKYGQYIIGAVNVISGIQINSMFRKKLRLLHHGYVMSTLAIGCGTGVMSAVAHEYFVMRDIMLHQTGCPLCHQVKAIISVNANGILHPLLTAAALNLSIAGNIGYRVPYMTEVREVVKLWWSVIKPNTTRLSYLLFVNSLFAGLVTYKQLKSMEIVTKVLAALDKYSDEELSMLEK